MSKHFTFRNITIKLTAIRFLVLLVMSSISLRQWTVDNDIHYLIILNKFHIAQIKPSVVCLSCTELSAGK